MIRQSSSQVEREKTINISPVCRFGPGGDYTFNWPLEWFDKAHHKWPNPAEHPRNILLRLLDVFVGTIVTLRGSTTEYSISGPDEIAGSQPPYTETLLFADDLTASKAAHRIRTYRPLAKKKPSFQPTLFDAEFKSARTA